MSQFEPESVAEQAAAHEEAVPPVSMHVAVQDWQHCCSEAAHAAQQDAPESHRGGRLVSPSVYTSGR
jgi:hypothetical protein